MLYRWIIGVFFDLAFNARSRMEPTPLGKGTEYEELAHKNAKWIRENETELLCTTSFDGYKLEGHYYQAKSAERLVICFHGWRGLWEYDFAPQTLWYLENGCNVLLVEQRGQGNSEYPYMTFGINEAKDAATWVEYICENGYGDLPIYLHGISMGASTVMMAVGESIIKERVSGVVADCGFSSGYDMIYRYGHAQFKIPKHPIMDSLNKRCESVLGFRITCNSPQKVMADNQIPMLFVHGLEDDFVPVEMTELDYKICPAPKKLLLVEGAGHAMSFYVDKERYTEALKEFFGSTISK